VKLKNGKSITTSEIERNTEQKVKTFLQNLSKMKNNIICLLPMIKLNGVDKFWSKPNTKP